MNSNAAAMQPITGALRILEGRRLKDAAPCTAILHPSQQAAPSRQGEHLLLLIHLTGPASPHLYRELREIFARTYWAGTGGVTAALRQSAAAVNRHLYQANLSLPPAERPNAGLICAVWREKDAEIFILRAGPAYACLLQNGQFDCPFRNEPLPPLGVGPVADVRVHHAFAAPGDRLLLASAPLVRAAGNDGLTRALSREGVADVLESLEQVGAGTDFVALVARWPRAGESAGIRDLLEPLTRFAGERFPSRPPEEESEEEPVAEAPSSPLPSLLPRLAAQVKERFRPAPAVEPPATRVLPPVEPPEDEIGGAGWQPAPRAEEIEPPAGRPASAEPAIAAVSLPPEPPPEPEEEEEYPPPAPRPARRVGDFLRRLLPDRMEAAAPRVGYARPVPSIPQENPAVMAPLALGVILAVVVLVTATYLTFGKAARFESLIRRAEAEIALAQAAGEGESSRAHWEAAYAHAQEAIMLRPEDSRAGALRAQAAAALDRLDDIVRLQPIQLKDLGQSTAARQLAVHGQMIFVLDPAGGWVAKLTLAEGGAVALEPGSVPILVRTGQTVGSGKVGRMVDIAWVDLAGGRQTSGLLILEEDGALVSYDPAWVGEGGAPQIARSFLGAPPAQPAFIGTYEGRFYVLDVAANQIRRYEPMGDTYPDRPDNYFTTPPPRPLAEAREMAIDGRIYILYADGEIRKFLRGEPEAFNVRDVPGGLGEIAALAVDPYGSSGYVYVAERGGQKAGRVIALGPDGQFMAQFHAGAALDAVEALAVDETARRLYAISGGWLYVAALPLP